MPLKSYFRKIVFIYLTKLLIFSVTFCVIFQFLTMLNIIVGAGAVEAGAASRYGSGSGSGSDQNMRLLAAPAPQHWKIG
jgi:hypothetical protein